MSYKQQSPLPIIEGGTAVQLMTPYAVICGGIFSTTPIQFVDALVTDGLVLTANGPFGGLPSFRSIADIGGVIELTGNSGGAILPLLVTLM